MMRSYVVLCDGHGLMEHSVMLYRYYCLTCSRYIDDEEVRRLVLAATNAPEEELLSIVVT